MECFESPPDPAQAIARLEVVGRHASSALYNAIEYCRIPMRFLWLPLAKVQEGLGSIPMRLLWLLLFIPLRVLGGVLLFLLDQIAPRYLLAAALVAPLAAVAYLGLGISLKPFLILVVLLGTVLAGMWENSEVFSGRALLRLIGAIPHRK
jgi:hypothetical protein